MLLPPTPRPGPASRALLLALVTGVLATPGRAADPDAPPVFPPRTRLTYPAAKLERLRTDPEAADERERILRQADKLLEQDLRVPQQEGNWIFYYACPVDGTRLRPVHDEEHRCPACQAVYADERTVAAYRTVLFNALERDLLTLGRAYALTEEERFCAPVRAAFLELARLYPTFTRHDRWGRTGLMAVVGGRRYAQHLDEAASAVTLARAYDLVADAPCFTPDDRNRIEQDFLRATVMEIRRYQVFVDARGVNNHITWFNAAYANVGVAIRDPDLLRQALHGKHGLDFQLAHSVTSDGLWYEGTLAYHFYALRAVQETLTALTAVGWDLSGDPRLKSLYLGPAQLAYPDGTMPVFNDSDPMRLQQWGEFFRFAEAYFDDPVFASFTRPPADAGEPAGDAASLPSADLDGIGIAVLRRGAGRRAVCAMMDYGIHGGHHGHPDKLNIVLYALGREWLPDPGRITYSVPEYESWARTTAAHNTLVVNGRNQVGSEGRLLEFRVEEDAVFALGEARHAYPGYVLRRGLVLTDTWMADILTVHGRGSSRFDCFHHVAGQLEPPAPAGDKPTAGLFRRLKPLGEEAGYQHLEDLFAWQSEALPKVGFRHEPGGRIVLHRAESRPAELWTGLGIGYRVQDRVPFLLRRVEGPDAVFATVIDVSGDGSAVSSILLDPGTEDAVALELQTPAGTVRIEQSQPGKAAAPALRLRRSPHAGNTDASPALQP